ELERLRAQVESLKARLSAAESVMRQALADPVDETRTYLLGLYLAAAEPAAEAEQGGAAGTATRSASFWAAGCRAPPPGSPARWPDSRSTPHSRPAGATSWPGRSPRSWPSTGGRAPAASARTGARSKASKPTCGCSATRS